MPESSQYYIDQSLPGPVEDEFHAALEVFEDGGGFNKDGSAVLEEPGHETFGGGGIWMPILVGCSVRITRKTCGDLDNQLTHVQKPVGGVILACCLQPEAILPPQSEELVIR